MNIPLLPSVMNNLWNYSLYAGILWRTYWQHVCRWRFLSVFTSYLPVLEWQCLFSCFWPNGNGWRAANRFILINYNFKSIISITSIFLIISDLNPKNYPIFLDCDLVINSANKTGFAYEVKTNCQKAKQALKSKFYCNLSRFSFENYFLRARDGCNRVLKVWVKLIYCLLYPLKTVKVSCKMKFLHAFVRIIVNLQTSS